MRMVRLSLCILVAVILVGFSTNLVAFASIEDTVTAGYQGAVQKAVKPTSVSLNETKKTLYVGDTFTLKATVKPANATNTAVTWTSDNKKIATVSKKGVVTAKKAGKVTITATTKSGNKKKACIITVKEVVPTGLELNYKAFSLKPKEKMTLKATVKPANATNTAVTWKSDNKKIATVSKKGVVTAKKAGKATITATTKRGKVVAKCKITVAKKITTKLTLSKSELTLKKSEEYTLSAKIAPNNKTDTKVTWKSSDASVVKVSSKGVLTALKAGIATITATTNGSKEKKTCKVTVKDIQPTVSPRPTEAPLSTDTPQATETPHPTKTPQPTETPRPTETPQPPFSITLTTDKTTYVQEEKIVWIVKASNPPAEYTGTIKFYRNGEFSDEIERIGTSFSCTRGYRQVGTYRAEVTFEDSAGKQYTATHTITVIASPVKVTLSADRTSAYLGEAITLTATAIGGTAPYTYAFIRDSYVISEISAGRHAFEASSSGSFKFEVVATDAKGVSGRSESMTVHFSEKPISNARITPNKASLKVGETITWTFTCDGGSGSFFYAYDVIRGEDDGVHTEWYTYTHPFQYTPTEAGVYRLYLEVYDTTAGNVPVFILEGGSVTVTE